MNIDNYNPKEILDVSLKTSAILMLGFLLLYSSMNFYNAIELKNNITLIYIFKSLIVYILLSSWAGANFIVASFISYSIMQLLFLRFHKIIRLVICLTLGVSWAILFRKFYEVLFSTQYLYMFIFLGVVGGLIAFNYTNKLKHI